jgi:MbtH protein
LLLYHSAKSNVNGLLLGERGTNSETGCRRAAPPFDVPVAFSKRTMRSLWERRKLIYFRESDAVWAKLIAMISPDAPTNLKVVVNGEEQYSVWPADAPNPPGWCDADLNGTRQDCLAHIAEAWTDMRPLSLRRHMDEAKAVPRTFARGPADDLFDRLSSEKLAVKLLRRRTLQEDLEAGYVHLQFFHTAGGTELGIHLDAPSCDLSHADLEAEVGTIWICGGLVLNSAPARCEAEIDLATLAGVAILVRLPA